MSEKSKKCVLCNSEDETLVIVGKRGIETLINSAVERGEPYYKFVDGIVVHEDCRKNYVSKRNIQQFNQRQLKASKLPVGKRTRSSSAPPNIKLCLFCGIELEHANGGKETLISFQRHVLDKQYAMFANQETTVGHMRFLET